MAPLEPDVNGGANDENGRTAIALSLLGMVSIPFVPLRRLKEHLARCARIIAFQQRDNAKINALIDKKVGMYKAGTELGLPIISG